MRPCNHHVFIEGSTICPPCWSHANVFYCRACTLACSISPPCLLLLRTINNLSYACDDQDTIKQIMHACMHLLTGVNSTKDTYVVLDFSACISTGFYNNIFDNIAMFNWQVGPRSLPPPQTVVGMYVLLGKMCGCSLSPSSPWRKICHQTLSRSMPVTSPPPSSNGLIGRLPPPISYSLSMLRAPLINEFLPPLQLTGQSAQLLDHQQERRLCRDEQDGAVFKTEEHFLHPKPVVSLLEWRHMFKI